MDPDDMMDVLSDVCQKALLLENGKYLLNYWAAPEVTKPYFVIDIGIVTRIYGFYVRNGHNAQWKNR